MLAAEAAAPGVRVLAVITGGWSLPQVATDEHYSILDRQLHNYVQACELVHRRPTQCLPHGSSGDDAVALPHHFAYFFKWLVFLNGTNFVPGPTTSRWRPG